MFRKTIIGITNVDLENHTLFSSTYPYRPNMLRECPPRGLGYGFVKPYLNLVELLFS